MPLQALIRPTAERIWNEILSSVTKLRHDFYIIYGGNTDWCLICFLSRANFFFRGHRATTVNIRVVRAVHLICEPSPTSPLLLINPLRLCTHNHHRLSLKTQEQHPF